MKKRILSILLVFCMMMSFVPITVFAAGGAKTILPGTSAQSILKIDKSRLSFAGHEWWVIGQKTDKSNNAPIITLLAVNNDFGDVPFRTGSDGPFENARRYSEDNGYYANNPSDMSQWRKPNEYAGSTLQQKMVSLAEAIPEKEQAVIRPKDITEGITGQEVKAQKLWAFSQEDSIYLYRNSCKYAAQWWTRSSNEVYGYGSWTIHPDGRSGSALNVDYDAAVRPAMEMDLSSVLFISAAEHGKVADLTTPIAEYAGDEWKLTLHDSDRDDFTAKTVLVNGSVLEVEYKNAKVGDNEYISAVIKDADGSISRYTRVVQLDGTTNGTRGRAAIDLTGIDMTGKTLCVFNEQFNGDHKTDYAGALREVKLTDEIDEQFTLTPGGTYYFDLSGANIPGTANGSLPDSTLHYVPFTYTGTVYAYSLSSNSSGVASSSQAASTAASSSAQYGYARDHSLFIADYAVAHTVSWLDLNAADLIFGKDYASGKISYALRAPSVGSNHKLGSDADEHGDPENNEWDAILNKARQDWQDNTTGYIKNWKDMYSTGQDTAEAPSTGTAQRMKRGYPSVRRLSHSNAGTPLPYDGFRPVLEVLNPGTLGPDGLKVVTLDLGGGKLGGSSEDIQIIVKNGSAFTAPASGGLTRPDGNTGSYFMWLDGNGNSYEPGSSVPADVTELTVQWTAPTYTVTLHANGGTIADGKDVTGYTYGVGATLPTDVTRTGYTFKGWYDNENLTGSPVTAISNTETGNKEYWAKWEINQYTITFDTAGGSTVASITQDYGTAITAPADPTREGYTFIGWDKAIPTTMPAENMTITAKWKVNQYTITFDSNGGSEIAPITQDYGTAITAPANPTREGYTFIGWNKAIPATMPAENMTITAKWKVNQYTITFDSNGGSEIAPITQDYGTVIAAPANPTREGYTFIGWDKAIPSTMPAENMTITAKWKDNQYTITFDSNGGSEIAPITQVYGTAIAAPANPTREGYTFIGWDKAIPSPKPAEKMIITAKWKVNQYTITFDSNGGSEIAPITQVYGTAIAAPANPTREGYTFIGWDKAIPSTMPAEKMIITAKWAVNQYTITFDTAGGSAVASITQDYGTAITAPADPTREGYTFIGWDKAIPTTMPAENMIITAKWRDIAVPTGEIKIAENGWKSFLNTITFGLFFKDTQMVTVTAADNSGEAVKIEYLLSDKALTESELAGMTFTAYSAPFSINPDNEYIIYVRLTDNAGNTDYICSDGIVLDGTSPVITGIENGKTYCAAQTVTVDEKYVDTVTVNGTAVTLDENGSFTLAPADGGQKIVVTDKAGNTAEMTVTVNDGHTYGEWVSNGDGTHTRQCTVDGCNGFEAKECSGGKATCAEKAVCEICGKAYGELDPKNHTDLKHIPAKAATEDAEGNIEHWYCSGCNNYYSDKDGTKEIKKTDTVTAKLPKSPPTGDTSNLMLWIALLFISGGVLTGVTVFDKRKRHSVK